MAFKMNSPKLFGNKKQPLDEAMTIAPVPSVGKRGKSNKKAARSEIVEAQDSRRRMVTLGVFLAAVAALIIGVVAYDNVMYARSTAYISAAGEMRMLSQRLAKSSSLALQGNAPSFAQLRDSREQFGRLLLQLGTGGTVNGVNVPPSPDSVRKDLDALERHWEKLEKAATTLLSQERHLITLGKSVAAIDERNTELLELSAQLTTTKLQDGSGIRDVGAASQLVMLSQRIAKNANALLGSGSIRSEVAFMLSKDKEAFQAILENLTRDNNSAETRETLKKISTVFAVYQGAIEAVLENLQSLVQAKLSGSEVFNESDALLEEANALQAAYQSDLSARGVFFVSMLVLGLAFIGILIGMVRLNSNDMKRRAEEAETQHKEADRQRQASESTNRQNQDAILRLMNELGDLADGDLTVTATVSEDITGAIADSINYTIEELRVLVGRIDDAALRVTQATEIARTTSQELMSAAEKQSEEINIAGESALQMAKSMNDVSSHASQSAQVARASLAAADKGATAVQDSIRSMDEIRIQIQETSKRIKRLGESSQEIGEIVELISDITEQTNVLALNAAIQAASAGEAGRGFTVVAEEVQRLAERSAEATKQISALVKTIQTDTQDAVSAMEQSTQGVVEGAKRSDAAGQALSEIGQVSRDLAALIENISSATQKQSLSATQIAELMQDILRITQQTTVSTNHTAEAVDELTALASELKGSVAGFRVN
ncbi:MAG: methyl-accepting chemotaxis protein [Zoogloeaceae bacterium]|jgi:twitching motility protein PilJ|nr:methyl-accepting chemotaxis protein [Zoogloeaceae bacterium]